MQRARRVRTTLFDRVFRHSLTPLSFAKETLVQTIHRRLFIQALGAAAMVPGLATAQSWQPGRALNVIVSYPPGGGADLMARIVAPALGQRIGATIVVENKPGASGQIAAAYVARSKPDGATVLLDASSYAVNESLYPRLPYDTRKDFVTIGVLATFPNVLVCNPDFEARSVAELIALAKANPGGLAYASSGNGSAQHLAGALFEERAEVELVHVPYRGGAPAMNDVVGGQVPLFFGNVASTLGHIRAGRLRPLAVTSLARASSLPDVPTMQEAGVPEYEVLEWNPLVAPAATPEAIQASWKAALRAALSEPDVARRVEDLGGRVFDNAPDNAAKDFVEQQMEQWAQVIRSRNIVVG